MTRRNATYLGLCAMFVGALLALHTTTTRAASEPPLTTTGGVVAADHALASEVGAAILSAGGNAVDAAAAAAFALGVVNPTSSGIGGGGFAVVYVADQKRTYAIDFRELAPAALEPGLFVVDGKVDPSLSRSSGLAVGVPGEVAGLSYMVEHLGRLSLRQVVAPAARLARDGFPASWFLARAAERRGESVTDPALLALLAPEGKPLERGQRVRWPALAGTLERIGRRGASGFYRGPVAEDIVARVREAGGVMTLDDLADYRVRLHEPLEGSYGGYRIVTMPLPSSGGVALLEALGILDATGIDLAKLHPHSADRHHLVSQILAHAFADRARFLGDADPARLARDRLLAPDRLRALARRVSMKRVQPHDRYGDKTLGAAGPPARGGGTSHLCVIDGAGNAVALTTTVNLSFGAKMVAPRSGVVLNNEIDDFSLAAGVPNAFGLVQSDYNLVGPGKRPLSSMTPTLVMQGDRVVGCLGGSGGPLIISNTLQVFLNAFVFDMDARAAVSAPRLHHQWTPNVLSVEPEVPPEVIRELEKRGHKVKQRDLVTAVQLIRVRDDGTREAASDPRKGGAPAAAVEAR